MFIFFCFSIFSVIDLTLSVRGVSNQLKLRAYPLNLIRIILAKENG
jgi:hypothetical protein